MMNFKNCLQLPPWQNVCDERRRRFRAPTDKKHIIHNEKRKKTK